MPESVPFLRCIAYFHFGTGLDLMADGAHRVRGSGIEKSGVIAVH